MITELTEKEKAFMEALKQTGYKLGKAYKLISPDCTLGTARSEGSKLMKRLKSKGAFTDNAPQTAPTTALGVPQVAAVQLPEVSQPITKDSILVNCERVAGKAEKDKHYAATLKAYELQSKLLNLYDSSATDMEMYFSAIKRISTGSTDRQVAEVVTEQKVEGFISRHPDKT